MYDDVHVALATLVRYVSFLGNMSRNLALIYNQLEKMHGLK